MPSPRLRFAPSPTGMLHIGGVRTALFNWLYARKTGGQFILRIEDTDRERSTPENEAVIARDLAWLGLDWDEGPDVGGPHGPYRQTERLALYAEFADKLVARGAAYRCVCTKEDLDRQRAELAQRDPKAKFRYPGTCRDRKIGKDDGPSVLRLVAPASGEVVYEDLVFGEVRTPNDTQQDVVLMRTDGVPLYNLGAVVDDLTMGITLCARGRDHMINTPLQILLYRALGVEPPRFAHLPMLLAADGTKLSKRHGAVSVGAYRDLGVPPVGLLNYLVRFGWSFGDEEIFSLADLVDKFSWERCSRADGKFDPKKLSAIAFEHLKSPALVPTEAYVRAVVEHAEQAGRQGVDPTLVERALPLYRERAESFVEAAQMMDYLFCDEPVIEAKANKQLKPERAELLVALAGALEALEPFDAAGIEGAVSSFAEARTLALKDFAQAARVALTGRTATPGLFDVMALLGRDVTVRRLRRGAELCRAGAAG